MGRRGLKGGKDDIFLQMPTPAAKKEGISCVTVEIQTAEKQVQQKRRCFCRACYYFRQKEVANNGKQCLTIQEIAVITGKAQNTIYRYIREGKLKGYNMANNGKQCLTVTKENIERFFGIKVDSNGKQWQTMANNVNDNGKQWQTSANNGKQVLTTENFKALMDEYFEEKQSQLMKPLEQQAIYRAGELNKENQFLKARLETVIEENRELKESFNVLPGPITEIKETLEQQESFIAALEGEKQILQQEKEKAIQHIQQTTKKLQTGVPGSF